MFINAPERPAPFPFLEEPHGFSDVMANRVGKETHDALPG
jgi:hypothetical protein